MNEDRDSGWQVQGILTLSGPWGGLSIVLTEDRRWTWLLRLQEGGGHRTTCADHTWAELPDAMIAVEMEAERLGFQGSWALMAMLARVRQSAGQSWTLMLGLAPSTDGWFCAVIYALELRERNVLGALLAHHAHSEVSFHADWTAAMACADAWTPPELQTLCPCGEV